jgi:hypothetical protein
VSDSRPQQDGPLRAREALSDDERELAAIRADDVESAGRSCMAIIILLAIIIAVLAVWLVWRSLVAAA